MKSFRAVSRADASLAAEYVLARLREQAKHIWYQGRRKAALSLAPEIDDAALRLIAEHRLKSLGEMEARGLIAWASGTRAAILFRRALDAREIVELQADGRRCVALLDDVPAPEGLAFALHDLRHLEKFFDPAHHRAQIGFFRMFARALAHPDSRALDKDLDDTWTNERDKVLADMNGSPIFLFAVLKMKLKVAVRRRLARENNIAPPANGVLDDRELAAYAPILERWLGTLELEGPARDAARAISARRDHPNHARTLITWFTDRSVH